MTYPTQEMLAKDTVASAIRALTVSRISQFDQILWDPIRHVLSFRIHGSEYVNLWLNINDDGPPHVSERNGTPAADSEILWEDS